MITNRKRAAIATAALIIILVAFQVFRLNAVNTDTQPNPDPTPQIEKFNQADHLREIWISALEFCESRGYIGALNPIDLDGTPSYSSFQWKPSTFLNYGKQYGLISSSTTLADVPNLLKDYELQRNIIWHMIDDPAVNWYQQFPTCVKTRVGLPPK